ncbi:hypothetical protein HPO_07607 [Hyphomonas polymorpha PS728]|uniref:ABC transporter permease n=1 Tax=Hyphomonas polymorpha PS728 TaxID=1280954 RepID=A0A062VLP6_9PROT|nr:DUF3526 domain-containing protein [Hyphomonas polymorpha]KCZ99075.1 hypothetical protein HPO_07607 [Hyphomonas polymorpha PS728]
MNFKTSFLREAWFLSKDRAAMIWLSLALLISAFSVVTGIAEVRAQRQTIERLLEADRADREASLADQSDWGGAAYYAFHLTYDPPSELAFAALGQRDVASWKHRVRMLALEGQIHEADPQHPDAALIGRVDFAFVAAFLAPLFVVLMLYDLRAAERAAGRYELLSATARRDAAPWRMRAGVRIACLAACLLIPFLIGAVLEQASGMAIAGAGLAVLLHLAFWGLLTSFVGRLAMPPATILTAMAGTWLLLAVLVPAAGRVLVERAIPVPAGADIMMVQRESVNDGWDRPREATMKAFLERHPEWSAYSQIEQGFEWKWYYAFQQVGDQTAEDISRAYDEGRHQRDRAASLISWLAPPALMERTLQSLAGTDVAATLAYEESIRNFHAELRAFYYPRLFREEDYSLDAVRGLPAFDGKQGANASAAADL